MASYRASIGTNTMCLVGVGAVGEAVRVDVGVTVTVGDGVTKTVGDGVGVTCVCVPPDSTAPMSHVPKRVALIWSRVGQFVPLSTSGLPDSGRGYEVMPIVSSVTGPSIGSSVEPVGLDGSGQLASVEKLFPSSVIFEVPMLAQLSMTVLENTLLLM